MAIPLLANTTSFIYPPTPPAPRRKKRGGGGGKESEDKETEWPFPFNPQPKTPAPPPFTLKKEKKEEERKKERGKFSWGVGGGMERGGGGSPPTIAVDIITNKRTWMKQAPPSCWPVTSVYEHSPPQCGRVVACWRCSTTAVPFRYCTQNSVDLRRCGPESELCTASGNVDNGRSILHGETELLLRIPTNCTSQQTPTQDCKLKVCVQVRACPEDVCCIFNHLLFLLLLFMYIFYIAYNTNNINCYISTDQLTLTLHQDDCQMNIWLFFKLL